MGWFLDKEFTIPYDETKVKEYFKLDSLNLYAKMERNMEEFKVKLHDDAFVERARNEDTALKAIQELVSVGILKEVNVQEGLMKRLSKCIEDDRKKSLSVEQQAALKAKQPQH